MGSDQPRTGERTMAVDAEADEPVAAGLSCGSGELWSGWLAVPPGEPPPAGSLPTGPGAYVLALWAPCPLPLPPRFLRPGREHLPAGWYLYAGSARGPGGIAARVRRHLNPDKRRHWHVDWVTTAPGVRVRVLPVPGGDECALVADMRARLAVGVPVPGFGASDCRCCPAHLLRFDPSAHPDAGAEGCIP